MKYFVNTGNLKSLQLNTIFLKKFCLFFLFTLLSRQTYRVGLQLIHFPVTNSIPANAQLLVNKKKSK